MPGSTMATRTLNVFISPASASLNASSAHFDEVYGASGALEIRPATDDTLIMQPLRRFRM